MPVYIPPYLAPQGTGPLEGTDLEDAIHDLIAGITGLDGTLVRPRWQPEPANIPAAATAWCAFGFQPDRTTTSFPEVVHSPTANAGAGADTLHQHETISVLVSFYDLGAGGQADKYCAMLRDGLFIAQNREALFQAGGMLLVDVGSATPAPVLLKERWQYRVDFSFQVRRQIDRTYAVPSLTAGDIDLKSQASSDGIIEAVIHVTPPES